MGFFSGLEELNVVTPHHLHEVSFYISYYSSLSNSLVCTETNKAMMQVLQIHLYHVMSRAIITNFSLPLWAKFGFDLESHTLSDQNHIVHSCNLYLS